VDPFFGLPLARQTPCRGHVLWAYNVEHLELLRRFVAATIRERHAVDDAPASLVEQLPAWMKAAESRAAVLAAIAALSD
jgi:hypothetical protein